METYKEKLKIQNIITGVGCAVFAVLSVLGFLAEAGIVNLTPAAGDSHWQSTWRGFLSGASMGILALMLFNLIRGIRALKNEQELKKMYIKEHDERTIQVWTSARASSMQTSLILGLVAIIISGYFNTTISLTILACVLGLSFITLGFKIYYSRKF